MPITSCFSYSDLAKLDPNVATVTKYVRTEQPKLTAASQVGLISGANAWDQLHNPNSGTVPWSYRDHATYCAVILGSAVPALMMDLALTGLHFTSTNRNLTTVMDGSNNVTTLIGNCTGVHELAFSRLLRHHRPGKRKQDLHHLQCRRQHGQLLPQGKEGIQGNHIQTS